MFVFCVRNPLNQDSVMVMERIFPRRPAPRACFISIQEYGPRREDHRITCGLRMTTSIRRNTKGAGPKLVTSMRQN